MNLELVARAKEYVEKMANGINPLTGETVSDNDVINNVKISRCLFYVSEVLEEVLLNRGVGNPNSKKIPFHLSRELINKYEFSNEDLAISKIVEKINNLKVNADMANLKVSQICNWLISIGLLMLTEANGKVVKRPTKIGEEMGMYVQHRVGQYTNYSVVLYKRSMQEFIIDNFESLLEFINQQC